MPLLAPGSLINITPNQQNNSPPDIDPLGTPPDEIVPVIESPQEGNTTPTTSRANSNTMSYDPLLDQPPSPPIGNPPPSSPSSIPSTLQQEINVDPENNNILSSSDFNGFMSRISQGVHEYKEVDQTMEPPPTTTTSVASTDSKVKPPALDLSSNQPIIFPQR